MRLYIWSDLGLYIQANITVLAESIEQATELINNELYNIGLSRQQGKGQITSYELDQPKVIISDNGDY